MDLTKNLKNNVIMEAKEMAIVKPRKVGAVADGADCRFVRIKNNMFRVAAIKSVRIEGVSLKVFLLEEMYARVTFETPEKAWACWVNKLDCQEGKAIFGGGFFISERAAKERERAEKERERAEKERERAEKERERAEKEEREKRAIVWQLSEREKEIVRSLSGESLPG